MGWCTEFHTSVDVFSIRVFICVCVCRSSCLVLQGKCFVVPCKKDRRIQKAREADRMRERLHTNKKKKQEEIKEKRIRKETSSVCAFCGTIPKRRTERIIFCCRRYRAGPIFFFCLSIRPLFFCVYICECVSYSLILRVPCLHIF